MIRKDFQPFNEEPVQKVKEEGKKRPVTKEVTTDFRFDDVAYTKYLIKVK